jgi:hypothetical protein
MVDGAHDPLRFGFFQDLVVPGSLVVGMQEDVRVTLDEAGQQRQPGQVDGRADGIAG